MNRCTFSGHGSYKILSVRRQSQFGQILRERNTEHASVETNHVSVCVHLLVHSFEIRYQFLARLVYMLGFGLITGLYATDLPTSKTLCDISHCVLLRFYSEPWLFARMRKPSPFHQTLPAGTSNKTLNQQSIWAANA